MFYCSFPQALLSVGIDCISRSGRGSESKVSAGLGGLKMDWAGGGGGGQG